MTFTVAIIGRPNVGKSTLFNRLVGRREAMVDKISGVTRDRREGQGRIGDLSFRLFDTAGLEDADDNALEGRMRRQTEAAIDEADVILMLVDARLGLTPMDRFFAQWLRRSRDRIVLVANKCEGRAARAGLLDAYGLGLGEPVALSAEHGEGLAELYDAVSALIHQDDEPAAGAQPSGEGDDIIAESPDGAVIWRDTDTPRVLSLAIAGRPNVGKSTLMNQLLGENRVLTGPEAGITRDAIAVEWSWQGQPIRLVDTAGLRRQARVDGRLERASGAATLHAIGYAHVVVLVLDATQMLERQDLTIARTVIEEGRALVLAANKWDLVDDHDAAMRKLRRRIEQSLPQVRGVPHVTLSALHGRNVDRLLAAVLSVYDVWNQRISTSHLNRWLAAMVERHPPPLAKGRRIRLRYITQAKARPPTFACFCSQPDALPDAYTRYLVNGLRETFTLPAVPVRFMLRRGRNPYVDKDA